MLVQQIKAIKSGRKELRVFAITMAVVLVLVGGFLLWRDSRYYLHLWGLAGLFLLTGLTVPSLLKPVHKIWMTISIVVGTVMTAVILCLLFYLIFTLAGLLARLFGKRFLQWKFDPDAKSYWVPRKLPTSDRSLHERQF